MKNKILKKQLIIFFVIAFGIPLLMGPLLYIAKSNNQGFETIPILQMYTPALGAMAAMFLTTRKSENFPKIPFIIYIVFTIIIIGLTLVSVFFLGQLEQIVSIVVLVSSIFLLLGILGEKKKKRTAYNLDLKNFRKVVLVVLLFIVLYFLRVGIYHLFSSDISGFLAYFSIEKVGYALSLIFAFFLSMAPFFGEEYGWRYFLQPILQKKFGMVKGLIVLGILWGLWHLPLNLFYYSAQGSEIYSLVNQIFICIGFSVIFGFAYGYTGSIWASVLMHFFNNNLILFFTDTMDTTVIQNQELNFETVIVNAVLSLVLYGVFIFSKYNRDKKYRVPTPNERLEQMEVGIYDEIE